MQFNKVHKHINVLTVDACPVVLAKPALFCFVLFCLCWSWLVLAEVEVHERCAAKTAKKQSEPKKTDNLTSGSSPRLKPGKTALQVANLGV